MNPFSFAVAGSCVLFTALISWLILMISWEPKKWYAIRICLAILAFAVVFYAAGFCTGGLQ